VGLVSTGLGVGLANMVLLARRQMEVQQRVHEVPHDDAGCFHRAADRTMMMTSQTVTDGVDVPSSHDHCVGDFTSTPHVPSTAASSPFRISNS